MQYNYLSPTFAVAPQIQAQDVATIYAAGFKTILCNRPDKEVESQNHAKAIEEAAKECGITFLHNPFDAASFCAQNIKAQENAIQNAESPILAYCASGRRSSVAWAFANAKMMPIDDIITALNTAGYDLPHLRVQLESYCTA